MLFWPEIRLPGLCLRHFETLLNRRPGGAFLRLGYSGAAAGKAAASSGCCAA